MSNDSNNQSTTSYDTLPYPPYSFPATHIGRLAAIGRLFGLPAAAPAKARVLEMGCGIGANMLAMGQLFPDAEFVGFDISSKQIGLGLEAQKTTGIDNVRLFQADIAEVGEDLGQFDYIITHGIFSWVPEAVKEAILRHSRERLNPNGIAYISYNCLPGWRMRGALRDMMMMHCSGIADLPGKVAQGKALIKFLAESCAEDTPYGKYMKQELELLRNTDDSYIAHEFFEDENQGYYFTDFLKLAAKHNLAYLGDAELATMLVDNLPAAAAQTLKSLNLNLLATEQYMDFLRNRMFRSTLLCHTNAPIQRNIDPKALEEVHVASLLQRKQARTDSQPAIFVGINGMELTVQEPFTAQILDQVVALGRTTRPSGEIIDAVMQEQASQLEGKDPAAVRGDLGRVLIQAYFKKLVDFSVGPLSLRKRAGENPEALPLARWQAANGLRISGPRLDMLNADAFVAKFITLCDGTRNFGGVQQGMQESYERKEYQLNENNQPIEDANRAKQVIEQLCKGSLNNLEQVGVLTAAADSK